MKSTWRVWPKRSTAPSRRPARAFVLDFALNPTPVPKTLGTRVLSDVKIADLIPLIDWHPFFQTWQLRGKYPNRGYPKIFNDEAVGEEAKKLHADAMKMIEDICAKKTLKAKGVVGIWPANSVGDDIEVYAADGSGAKLGTSTMSQAERRDQGSPRAGIKRTCPQRGLRAIRARSSRR